MLPRPTHTSPHPPQPSPSRPPFLAGLRVHALRSPPVRARVSAPSPLSTTTTTTKNGRRPPSRCRPGRPPRPIIAPPARRAGHRRPRPHRRLQVARRIGGAGRDGGGDQVSGGRGARGDGTGGEKEKKGSKEKGAAARGAARGVRRPFSSFQAPLSLDHQPPHARVHLSLPLPLSPHPPRSLLSGPTSWASGAGPTTSASCPSCARAAGPGWRSSRRSNMRCPPCTRPPPRRAATRRPATPPPAPRSRTRPSPTRSAWQMASACGWWCTWCTTPPSRCGPSRAAGRPRPRRRRRRRRRPHRRRAVTRRSTSGRPSPGRPAASAVWGRSCAPSSGLGAWAGGRACPGRPA